MEADLLEWLREVKKALPEDVNARLREDLKAMARQIALSWRRCFRTLAYKDIPAQAEFNIVFRRKEEAAGNRTARAAHSMGGVIGMKIKGNIVATYKIGGATVLVSDAAYAGKSEEELETIRMNARRVAQGIFIRAALRKSAQAQGDTAAEPAPAGGAGEAGGY